MLSIGKTNSSGFSEFNHFLQDKWVPLFTPPEDSEYYDLIGKYGLSTINYINAGSSELYIVIQSIGDDSVFFCFQFTLDGDSLRKQLLAKDEFKLIQGKLQRIKVSISSELFDGSILSLSSKHENGEYQSFFIITDPVGEQIDISTDIAPYQPISSFCINSELNEIVFIAKDKNYENPSVLRNYPILILRFY